MNWKMILFARNNSTFQLYSTFQLQFYNSGVMLYICRSAFYDLVRSDQNVIKMRTMTQQNSAWRMTVHLNYNWSIVSVDFVFLSSFASVYCQSTQSICISMQHFLLFPHSNIAEVNASTAVYIYNLFSKVKKKRISAQFWRDNCKRNINQVKATMEMLFPGAKKTKNKNAKYSKWETLSERGTEKGKQKERKRKKKEK